MTFNIETIKKIIPIQTKIFTILQADHIGLSDPIEKNIENEIQKLITFLNDGQAFLDTDHEYLMNIIIKSMKRNIEKHCFVELFYILNNLADELVKQIPENEQNPKKNEQKTFKPGMPPSERKDGYIPKAYTGGGIGTPLFNNTQVLGEVKHNKIYKPVADHIIKELKKPEYKNGFSIKNIREILGDWYKKHREISESTRNAYTTHYLTYFTDTNQIERTKKYNTSFHLKKTDKAYKITGEKNLTPVIEEIYKQTKGKILNYSNLIKNSDMGEAELLNGMTKLISIYALRQRTTEVFEILIDLETVKERLTLI